MGLPKHSPARVFSKTFPAYGSTGTGYNRATSAIMNQALVGSYPQLHLSYPKLLIAKGMLPGAEEASAVAADDGSICFRFTDNNNTGTASGADKIVLVVYAPVLQQALFSLHAGCAGMGQLFCRPPSLRVMP